MRADAPFFLAEGGAVLVARSVVVDDDATIAKAYERVPPSADRAWGEVAELIEETFPKAKAYANPLIVDGWRDVVAKAKAAPAGELGMIFSSPGGVEVKSLEVLEALDGCAQPWLLDVHGEMTAPGAWTWKAAGLAGRSFVSNFEPPKDGRVLAVVGPDGQPRTDKITKGARRVKFVRKDDASSEQRMVLGIVLEPEVVDSQGDIYSADEVARAAHGWMEDFQNLGHMHRALVNNGVKPVESYVAPVDFEIDGQSVKAGTWLLVVHVVNDALWAQVKAGELTGFSIGGYAQRIPDQTAA